MALIPTSDQKQNKQGWFSEWLGGSNPIYNQLPTRSGFQQAAQMPVLGAALYNQLQGFNAPSIAPAQREATRHFQQEVVPGIMENFAGGGSQGALTRGLQGASSDLQSRLAALQYEKQFELQKQRQEQIPRLLELGMSPSFQAHLTNKPIENLPETFSSQVSQDPRVAELLRQSGMAGSEAAGTAAKGVEIGRRAARVPGIVGRDLFDATNPKVQQFMNKYAPKANKYMQSIIQRTNLLPFERAKIGAPENPITTGINKEYLKKIPGGISPQLSPLLEEKHRPMIDAILKHRRGAWKQGLQRVQTPAQLEELYKLAVGKKPSRSTLNRFVGRLGKGK